MKVRVDSEKVERASRFLSAATVTGRATALPILSYLLLDASQEHILRMAATNLNVWLEWQVDAEVEEPGKVAVPAREWRGLCSRQEAETIRIEAPEEVDLSGRLSFSFGKAQYQLPILSADEFPLSPEESKWGPAVSVDGPRLAEALRRVLFCVSPDPTMGVFTGVHFRKEKEGGPTDIVATDTNRMALVSDPELDFPTVNITLPAGPMKVLTSLLHDSPVVECQFNGEQTLASFATDTWRMVMTALHGSFVPNYRRVIPSEFLWEISIPSESLASPLRRMTVFQMPAQRHPLRILLKMDRESADLELAALSSELGGLEEVGKELIAIERKKAESDLLKIAFQLRFLTEYLSVVKTGTLIARFQSSDKQAVWHLADDPTWLYIVMPVHVPGLGETG